MSARPVNKQWQALPAHSRRASAITPHRRSAAAGTTAEDSRGPPAPDRR